MKFYAADNIYATPYQIGFANTWFVWVFESKRARDAYVNSGQSRAARAIRKSQVGQYTNRTPKPFSGEAYAVESFYMPRNAPDGVIGQVSVLSPCELEYSGVSRVF